jgi:hypothetical protein
MPGRMACCCMCTCTWSVTECALCVAALRTPANDLKLAGIHVPCVSGRRQGHSMLSPGSDHSMSAHRHCCTLSVFEPSSLQAWPASHRFRRSPAKYREYSSRNLDFLSEQLLRLSMWAHRWYSCNVHAVMTAHVRLALAHGVCHSCAECRRCAAAFKHHCSEHASLQPVATN